MSEVEAFSSVVIVSTSVAQELVAVIDTFERVVRQRRDGSGLNQRVHVLRDLLRVSASDVSTDADVRTQEDDDDWLTLSEDDLLDTTQAARLLGCTPANVRDLARRHALPAQRSGGRWLFAAHAVAERAQLRKVHTA